MTARKGLMPILTALAGVLIPTGALASLIGTLVGQLSQADYQGYVMQLQGFGTRYYNTAGNSNAAAYLSSTLGGLGFSVRSDPFTYSGETYANIEASLPGVLTPERIFIIGAHFDSTSTAPATNAPGADDNASGVAALLEVASVFSQYRFDSTIRFVGFNAEEQGLIGSNAYAADAKAAGEHIIGMLNFDMIAYTGGSADEDLDLFGDNWLVDSFRSNAALYAPGLSTEAHYRNVYGSDHYYFYSSLFPGSSSLLAIEDTPNEIWGGSNPYYHKTTDTADRLDWGFAFQVTKAGGATLATIAGVRPVPEPPVTLLLVLGLPLLRLRSL